MGTFPEPTDGTLGRIWVTGGAGFVGSAVVRTLIGRGYEVIAPVRDSRRAGRLTSLGATVVEDDLSDVARMSEALRDVDAVVHAAGRYRIGIERNERGEMWDANIGTTTRVLDAAEAAATKRVVYVSTVDVFGNTHGQIVDETYRRDLREGFLSWYDQTKYGAHEVALQRIGAGAPVVIVQPSQAYGPGDRSEVGAQLSQAHAGRLRYRAFDDLGIAMVHIDDLATGITTALERGRPGQAYVLAGPTTTLGEVVGLAASIGGRAAPRLRLPTALIRLIRPVGRLAGQPNLAEVLTTWDGVTYWASARKATEELGFTARPIEQGLRDTLGTGAGPAPGIEG